MSSQSEDITPLLLGMLNGDSSRISEYIRRALRVIGSTDRDVSRIANLLCRPEFLSSRPDLMGALLNTIIDGGDAVSSSSTQLLTRALHEGAGAPDPVDPRSAQAARLSTIVGGLLPQHHRQNQITLRDFISSIGRAQAFGTVHHQPTVRGAAPAAEHEAAAATVSQRHNSLHHTLDDRFSRVLLDDPFSLASLMHSTTTLRGYNHDGLQRALEQALPSWPLLLSQQPGGEGNGSADTLRNSSPAVHSLQEEDGANETFRSRQSEAEQRSELPLNRQDQSSLQFPSTPFNWTTSSILRGERPHLMPQEGYATRLGPTAASLPSSSGELRGRRENLRSRNDSEGRKALFPFILRDFLSDLEKSKQTFIAAWAKSGDAFQILREDLFEERLIRLYFQLEAMEDFRSTLRTWGFQVLMKENGQAHYKHPNFLRHSTDLHILTKMQQMTPQSRAEAPVVRREQETRPPLPPRETMAIDRNQLPADKERKAIAVLPASRDEDFLYSSTRTTTNNDRPTKRARKNENVPSSGSGHDEHRSRQEPWVKSIETESKKGRTKISTEQPSVDGKEEDGGLVVIRNSSAASSSAETLENTGERSDACMGTSSTKQATMALPSSSTVFEEYNSFRINHVHDSYDVSGLMFPWHLHRMLDGTEHDNATSEGKIIGWVADGASFFVYNRDLLASRFLPKYFGHPMSWSDFTSELSHWGFVCFTSGPQKGAFIHRLLLKGKPSLCKQMRYKGKTVFELITKNQSAFLLRLHDTLSLMKEGGSEAPACWSPDGKSFRLRKPASFLNEVFSACFDSLSFSVFEQRLRAWGFVRHPTDAPLGVVTSEQFTYSHPFFVEGKKPLITRLSGEMKGQSISVEHSFLIRLRVLLDDVERHGYKTVISWLSHGKSFMIHDRSYFSAHVLPRYFKNKLTSFRQTLRSYGFTQMGGRGWDSGSYYHKLFVRDDASLCRGLDQEAMKSTMPEWVAPQDEPNFYSDTTMKPSNTSSLRSPSLPSSKTALGPLVGDAEDTAVGSGGTTASSVAATTTATSSTTTRSSIIRGSGVDYGQGNEKKQLDGKIAILVGAVETADDEGNRDNKSSTTAPREPCLTMSMSASQHKTL